MRGDHKTFEVPALQADAVLDQAAPTSGLKYTVLNTTKNVRLISIAVKCTWTVQPNPLEVHLTIDGQAWTFAIGNAVTDTYYVPIINADDLPTAFGFDVVGISKYKEFLIEGRSVKVEAEVTGGTVSNLYCRVKYAKW